MGQIHHFHRRLLQVLHRERHAQKRGARRHGNLRRRQIIGAESDRMPVAATDRHGSLALVDLEPGFLERRVRQLAMQRMGVIGARCTEAGQAAMDHEGAIGFQIDLRVDGLVEHRPHREVAAVEPGAPDLLSLEGQHNDLAAGVADTQRLDPGVISEGRDGELASLEKPAFAAFETGTVKLDPDRHSIPRAQRMRSPLVSSKIYRFSGGSTTPTASPCLPSKSLCAFTTIWSFPQLTVTSVWSPISSVV